MNDGTRRYETCDTDQIEARMVLNEDRFAVGIALLDRVGKSLPALVQGKAQVVSFRDTDHMRKVAELMIEFAGKVDSGEYC